MLSRKKEVLKPLLVRTGKTPFQVFILIAAALSSVLSLMDYGRGSAAISMALDGRAWVWHALLLVASLLSLYGTFSQKLPDNLFIERIGMVWFASLFLAYGLGIALVNNQGRITSTVITISLVFAATARIIQITVDIKKLKKAVAVPTKEINIPLLADKEE